MPAKRAFAAILPICFVLSVFAIAVHISQAEEAEVLRKLVVAREAKSEAFCQAVLYLLDGKNPVIAAVKSKDIAFLNAVRAHPNVRCFFITSENRDALYEEVLEFMRLQLEERP